MRGAVTAINVCHGLLYFGGCKVGTGVASDTFGRHLALREAGVVQDGGQLHHIGMARAGNERIVLFELVDVVRQRMPVRNSLYRPGGMGLEGRIANGNAQHFRIFLVERAGVVAEEAGAVGVFSGDINRYTRNIRFHAATDDLKGRFMVFQFAVDQYEELAPCAGGAAVPGFHIREFISASEQFFGRDGRVVYIDDDAAAVAHHVFEFAASFHHAACHIEGQLLLVCFGFFRFADRDKAAQVGDLSCMFITLHLVDVLVQGH